LAGRLCLVYIVRHLAGLRGPRQEARFSAYHCQRLCGMGLPMGLQCSITAIGSVVLQSAVNGLGSAIVAAQTAGGRAGMILSVPLESLGTTMTTFTGQNKGACRLDRVRAGVNDCLIVSALYSAAAFGILHFADKLLICLFVDGSETEIIANAQKMLFWNSMFYVLLGTLIIYRYTLQGLGCSMLAMFAGVAEMAARGAVGFWFVGRVGYLAACIASPIAWMFACVFLVPAYFVTIRRQQRELGAVQKAAAAPQAAGAEFAKISKE